MKSSGDDWCKHYAGFFKTGIGEGKKTHCDAGVEYSTVEKKVEFTTQRWNERTPYTHHEAHPCFKHQTHLTDGCAKCEFYTPEELQARHEEFTAFVNRVSVAREAILQYLRRRWKEGPVPQHGVAAPADISRFCKPQTNYFCGSGKMKCPVCNTGTLSYSRSTYNGHVHAGCDTKDCVAWME